MNDLNQAGASVAPPKDEGFLRSILALLGSLKFALWIVAIIALACVAGTVIPQGEQVDRYMMHSPGPHKGLEIMASLGFTHVFYSWWFAALLCVLAASLLACTGKRYNAIRRTTGAARIRVIGSFITHVSLLLVLAGGVVRVVWGEKGVFELAEGDVASSCSGQTGPITLPFAIRLVNFELELYKSPDQPPGSAGDTLFVQWPEKQLAVTIPVELNKECVVVPPKETATRETTYRLTVDRYVPDFYMDAETGDAKSRSDRPNNPAIHVSVIGGGATNSEWVFARFPEFTRHAGQDNASGMPLQFRFLSNGGQPAMGRAAGPVKAFRSTVELIENDKVVLKKTIAVNSPLSYRGYTFYQLSYNPEDLRWTALQVVRDPGVPVVYAGFLLMMAGLTVVFCVGPYLDDRRKAKGEGEVV